ncbi:hypothetical protein K435DRAFT_861898 [Dendrothele bispora CBS 962.96]|uniref:Uncharacterized protein n=1 Tax=Dendrothele bispora (strain CBS 962.96) TaxID=1314807 RepID=A0A4S8LVA8_DENBC|nr:hypothetical protein K435DRAFT_861898 [Dendrothele bispora CBS 962.96]
MEGTSLRTFPGLAEIRHPAHIRTRNESFSFSSATIATTLPVSHQLLTSRYLQNQYLFLRNRSSNTTQRSSNWIQPLWCFGRLSYRPAFPFASMIRLTTRITRTITKSAALSPLKFQYIPKPLRKPYSFALPSKEEEDLHAP